MGCGGSKATAQQLSPQPLCVPLSQPQGEEAEKKLQRLVARIEARDVENLKELCAAADAKQLLGCSVPNHNGMTPIMIAIEDLKKHNDLAVLSCLLDAGAAVNQTLEGLSPLHLAVETGKLSVVSVLCKAKADVNGGEACLSGERPTPLMAACTNDCSDIVDELLKLGALPNIGTPSPLYIAANKGNVAISKSLLKAGANGNVGSNEETPLYAASRLGNTDLVSALMKHHSKKSNGGEALDVNRGRVDIAASPLYIACQSGNENVVEVLLENKDLDRNARHELTGATPLHVAAESGSVECVALLLEGATSEVVNVQRTGSGTTPLFDACAGGNKSIVDVLLKHGADVSIPQTANPQNTPLHACVLSDSPKIVTALIDKASAPVDAANADGYTPLMLAAQCGHYNVLYSLLKRLAIISHTAADGHTALTLACAGGYADCVTQLLEHGANPDDPETTPFFKAVEGGHATVVEALLTETKGEMKPESYGVSSDGFGPLHEAARLGHEEVVKCLLRFDSIFDMNAKQGEDMQTPLQVAAVNGRAEVCTVLLSHGADVSAEDEKGATAPIYAVYQGHAACVRVFLEFDAIDTSTTYQGEGILDLAQSDTVKAILEAHFQSGSQSARGSVVQAVSGSIDGRSDGLPDHEED